MKKPFRIGLLVVVAILIAATSVQVYLILDSRYTVTVKNDTSVPIKLVQISGGGSEVTIDSIDAGGSETRHFWIETDGRLELQHDSDNQRHIIDGYVTGSLGGDTTVTIHPDGAVTSINHRSE
ncbi:MAG: hypothetical protein KJO21_11675 [Verrucomicrobiae bacterium]|nr:hypothetical protein [Verrucomicrobiae bacterium]NNJ43689.1 hypothetical protein [Akkermansiaceae bacterium]